MSIIMRNDISLHVEKSEPKIRVGNKEASHILPAKSYITVTYRTDDGGGYESEARIFLDYASAKALAEGILAKLDDMQYKTILKQHALEQHKKAGQR